MKLIQFLYKQLFKIAIALSLLGGSYVYYQWVYIPNDYFRQVKILRGFESLGVQDPPVEALGYLGRTAFISDLEHLAWGNALMYRDIWDSLELRPPSDSFYKAYDRLKHYNWPSYLKKGVALELSEALFMRKRCLEHLFIEEDTKLTDHLFQIWKKTVLDDVSTFRQLDIKIPLAVVGAKMRHLKQPLTAIPDSSYLYPLTTDSNACSFPEYKAYVQETEYRKRICTEWKTFIEFYMTETKDSSFYCDYCINYRFDELLEQGN